MIRLTRLDRVLAAESIEDIEQIIAQIGHEKPKSHYALSNLEQLRGGTVKSNLVQSDDDDDDSPKLDWEDIAKTRATALIDLKTNWSNLSHNNTILQSRIARWETQFDLENLQGILDFITTINSLDGANQILYAYDRDWFIQAELSESGKVKVAQRIIDVVKPFGNFGDALNLVTQIAAQDAETLDDIWGGQTSKEVTESEANNDEQ